jgi:predicted protein tyrosine phosphatase
MSRRTKNPLFVCSQNKLRSPTAEQVFSAWEGVETLSAGTSNDARNPPGGNRSNGPTSFS